MAVHLIRSYLVALAGLGIGAAVGLILALAFRRVRTWDAWVTIPLLLAAAGAHIALICARNRQCPHNRPTAQIESLFVSRGSAGVLRGL